MGNNDTSAETGIQGIVFYPIEPYIVIISVLVAIACFQWAAFFHTKWNSRRRVLRGGETEQRSWRGNPVPNFRLALINFYRVLAFRTTVGIGPYMLNLAEACATVAYVTVLVVWTFIVASDPEGEPLNWCSRAALLAASQYPFVTILGTKNNIVSLITRISADKLNFIHRIAARACLILIGIHALGGGSNFSFYHGGSNGYETYGVVAALAFVALAVISLRPVRERVYEIFFYFHFVAVVVIMVGSIMHINSYSGANFTYYIWPSFIIWAADRLIRTGRLVYFNLAYFGYGRKSATLDATTELLSDTLVRVRFRRSGNLRWSPGQFAYLIMPSVSRLPFEAHPFSIASLDSVLFAPDSKPGEDSSRKELVFFIGVKSGFTRRLKDVAARGESVKVYVDGPYGEGLDLGCYHTAVLIAGGTGITFTLPTLLHIIESVRNGFNCCHRVVFIWSIRKADFLNWVSESLTKAVRFAPPALKVDIQVFLTGSRVYPSSGAPRPRRDFEGFQESSSNLLEEPNQLVNPPNPFEKPEEEIFTASWLKVAHGRPNLGHILDGEINEASGRIFVSVCGPNAIAKDVRKALKFPWSSRSGPLQGGPSVTLHVETFGYA